MTKDEALKLALDAFETSMYPQQKQLQAITAIKEALAQPEPWEKFCDSNCVWTDHHPDCKLAEQEPVAWITEWEGQYSSGKILDYIAHTRGGKVEYTPLYTTPPQRKPLTEQKIGAILEDTNAFGTRLYTFARAIEAAHGIKGEA